MMDATKIRLSPEEVDLANNADIILTKNVVMKKIQGMLAELQEGHQQLLVYSKSIPEEVKKTSPKISRGENYLGLPWLVLDQPRYFERDHIFAIRMMFWWGRSFIITLHLSGRYKEQFGQRLLKHYPELAEEHFHLCINEDQWIHHLGEDNYLQLKNAEDKEILETFGERSFLKLAKAIELGNINDVVPRLRVEFEKLLNWIDG